ncbi:MAG: hypothetical protein ABFS12_12770 [Bacteroidota bacterium]
METKLSLPKRVIILRWIARIIGTLVVVFFLMLFIGEFFRKGYISFNYPLMSVFMGLSMIGILLAWRWEGIGGFLGAISIVIFDLVNIFWYQTPKMTSTIIGSLLWLIPSIIFIYCWWTTKDKLKQQVLKRNG